jgi:predicted RNA methylase
MVPVQPILNAPVGRSTSSTIPKKSPAHQNKSTITTDFLKIIFEDVVKDRNIIFKVVLEEICHRRDLPLWQIILQQKSSPSLQTNIFTIEITATKFLLQIHLPQNSLTSITKMQNLYNKIHVFANF